MSDLKLVGGLAYLHEVALLNVYFIKFYHRLVQYISQPLSFLDYTLSHPGIYDILFLRMTLVEHSIGPGKMINLGISICVIT